MSPYLTNLWLDDIIDLSFVQHSFCDAARKGNYVWLQGKLIDLDRQNKRAFTSEGYIDYHFIALAPGIDYNYAYRYHRSMLAVASAQNFPAGFKPGSGNPHDQKQARQFREGCVPDHRAGRQLPLLAGAI